MNRKELIESVCRETLTHLLGPFVKLSIKFVRTNDQSIEMMLQQVETLEDKFIFTISSLTDHFDDEDFIIALVHECVHVSQFYMGHLIDLDDNTAWFRGTKFHYTNEDDIYYYFAPWEVEARGMQEALYYLYMGEI